MGMGFAPTWHRQVNPLLHKTTLTTVCVNFDRELFFLHWIRLSIQLDPERCMGGSRPNENDCVFITTKMHRNSNYTQRISTISVGNVCVGIGLWCCEKFEKVLLWESIIVPSKKTLCMLSYREKFAKSSGTIIFQIRPKVGRFARKLDFWGRNWRKFGYWHTSQRATVGTKQFAHPTVAKRGRRSDTTRHTDVIRSHF